MSDTFFVTPASELERLHDWDKPLAFQAAHHHENLNVPDTIEVDWRLRDRVGIFIGIRLLCLFLSNR